MEKNPLWINKPNNYIIGLKCGSMGKKSVTVQEAQGSNTSGILFYTIIYCVGIVFFCIFWYIFWIHVLVPALMLKEM